MEHVVILGGGFGGLTVATELEPLAASGKVRVTLVERNTHFRMGFNKQWVLDGRRRPDEGLRPYASLRARHVAFLHDAVAAIDTARRTAHLKSRRIEYDHLVVALGAELAPELVPGLAEGAYDLFDDAAIPTLKAAVEGMTEGTLIVAIASVPFKCPPAPYEYALLLDDMLRRRKVRQAVRLAEHLGLDLRAGRAPALDRPVASQPLDCLHRAIESDPGHDLRMRPPAPTRRTAPRMPVPGAREWRGRAPRVRWRDCQRSCRPALLDPGSGPPENPTRAGPGSASLHR